MKYKSPIAAFLLSFFPGVGHAFLGRYVRFVLYGGAFVFALGTFALAASSNEGDVALVMMVIGIGIWLINMLDMIVSLLKGAAGKVPGMPGVYGDGMTADFGADPGIKTALQQRERNNIVLMSFIPGLGHMSMGLMQRGVTFLIAFLGLGLSVIFITAVSNTEVFLIFLVILPVIWIYCLFDAMQQLHMKQRGEMLVDRPLFEELEGHMSEGRKSRVLGLALSVFPGAGHLYLGLQRRGIQLMAGFLLGIYLMDTLRLTLFFILLPLYWFFAFFDAYHQLARYEREPLRDEPVVAYLAPHQRWIGYVLIGLGAYYLIDRVLIQGLMDVWPRFRHQYMQIRYYFPTAIVSFLLIAGGLKLLMGPHRDRGNRAPVRSEEEHPNPYEGEKSE